MQGFFYIRTMQLTKLNEDSTWMLTFDGMRVLVDPWLSASQVDFHPWFSRQFHREPQLLVSELPRPDYIFISHPFSDHCNKETLLQFSKDIPVIALPSILKKIKSWGNFEFLLPLESAPFSLKILKSKRQLVHKAYLLESSTHAIVYAPHGAELKEIPQVKISALIASTLTYQLPFFLGGTINLGLSSALRLQKQLNAKKLFITHNENKRAEGLVARFARRTFEDSILSVELKTKEDVILD